MVKDIIVGLELEHIIWRSNSPFLYLDYNSLNRGLTVLRKRCILYIENKERDLKK